MTTFLADGVKLSDGGYVGARVPGQGRRHHDRPVKTSPAGRACDKCDGPLSIYNHETVCAGCSQEPWADHC